VHAHAHRHGSLGALTGPLSLAYSMNDSERMSERIQIQYSILAISTLLRVDKNGQRIQGNGVQLHCRMAQDSYITCGSAASAHIMASPFPPSYTIASTL